MTGPSSSERPLTLPAIRSECLVARIPRPLLAALVLPLVVIVGFPSAWAAFACRVDGEVRDHCCCKPAKQERDDRALHDVPRIDGRGCCDVTIHEATEVPVVREADRAMFDYTPVSIQTIASAIVTPCIERAVSITTMARPPPRIALFLDKHAILR